jgi:hypothetical protein
MTARQELSLGEANKQIDDARRLAYGSNKYASKAERQAMANEAGAVAAAQIATHNAVDLPTRSVGSAAEEGTVVDQGQERGRG